MRVGMHHMSRFLILTIACGLLAACGFRPLYLADTGSGPVDDEMAQIEVQRIADRRGQMLRNELVDRLNPHGSPAAPKYFLQASVDEQIRELASRIDDSSTRANLILTASFSLREQGAEQPLMNGRVQSTNNYSISQSDIATLAAERNARERGARDIAERMTLQIAAFLQASSDPAVANP